MNRLIAAGVAATMAAALAACHRKPLMWTPNVLTSAKTAKDFNVVWDHDDNNGSPLNPAWAPQRPPTSKLPPEDEECGRRPDTSNCTEHNTVRDVATLPNAVICNLELTSKLHGHVDWTPATTIGKVLWMGVATDGDYNFKFFPEGEAGLTTNNERTPIKDAGEKAYIEVEFNSHETADVFGIPWWVHFRDIAKEDGTGFDRIDPLLNVNHGGTASNAVMYGLFGLDCEHACRSEYHPIYVMAVEVDDRPDHNVWALFVRNWGDEGFCGQLNHELYTADDRIRIALPRKGARPTVVTEATEFRSSTEGAIPFPNLAYDTMDQQVVLTFTMPEPRRRIVGEMLFQIHWPSGFDDLPPTLVRGRETSPSREAPPARLSAEPSDAEGYFEALVRSRPQIREQVFQAGGPAVAAPARPNVSLHPSSPTLPDFAKPQITKRKPTFRLTLDEAKKSADEKRWATVCRAYNGQLPTYKGRDISKICKDVK